MLSTSGLSHYSHPNPPSDGADARYATRKPIPVPLMPPRPPSQTAPEPVYDAVPPSFARSFSRMSNEIFDQLAHPEL